jgi:hypothetical protein
MRGRSWVCAFALLLVSVPAFAVKVKSVSDGLTADQVAALVTGSGAKISNIKITGAGAAIGQFTEFANFGVANGLVLSTGNLSDVIGPNNTTSSGADNDAVGQAALDAVVAPYKTEDAAVLEFDVVTEAPTFSIRYIFASEEYREWVDSEYNDVFAFFVNGANIAVTPGTGAPVTINTINHLRNQGLYRDNEGGTETQFDGYTTPLLAVAVVEPGVSHHIRIAIADTSDGFLDSAVFIAAGGISGSQIAPIIQPRVDAVEAVYGAAGTEIALPLYYAFESAPPTLTASGIPGATFTFSPMYRGADGQMYTNMKIILGPDSPPGSHLVTIKSQIGEAESFATLIVVVDCQPPSILGIGQPQTQLVDRGTAATLRVSVLGSGPAKYQWFQGFTGMTRTPVSTGGGNTAELRTPPTNELTPYWVRVTNPCGSADSLTAFAIPK